MVWGVRRAVRRVVRRVGSRGAVGKRGMMIDSGVDLGLVMAVEVVYKDGKDKENLLAFVLVCR